MVWQDPPFEIRRSPSISEYQVGDDPLVGPNKRAAEIGDDEY